ncbi:MAG: putative two-component system sensor kinase [Solirubrobacterales bacterium]|nr:putative two-component system sensor kinase [Solirubrobacterales bacterium]
MRHSWLRSADFLRFALPALIVLLGVVGYVLTSQTIAGDRDAAAARRVQVESIRTRGLLERARAYVAGLGNVMAGERVATQRRFSELVAGTTGSVGLVDALWVQALNDGGRRAYERRLGSPVSRLTPSGRPERAPRASSYLPATYATRTRPELRPGVDVSGWRALAGAIRNPASVFAVAASDPGSLGGEPGFYLLTSGDFGRGPATMGYLAVFVPGGWLTVSMQDDPRRVEISLDGRPLEGRLDTASAAGASFGALAQRWRVDVGTEPPTGLQSLLPWLVLAWPVAIALVVYLVLGAILRRRRAETAAQRIFDLSPDLLGVASVDGYFKRVNPAFERALGYTSQELLSRPLFDFVHPDDRDRSREVLQALAGGRPVMQFENRYVCSDGSWRWLEWSTRTLAEEGLVFAAARDVTDRHRAEEQMREAQRSMEASRDELRVLVQEQAALRRVATHAARGEPPVELFAAVVEEVGRLLPVDWAGIGRYESGGAMTTVASWSRAGGFFPAIGSRWMLGGQNISTIVAETGESARVDSFADASGAIGVTARDAGYGSAVGTPIVVEGRLWGLVAAISAEERALGGDTEERLARFTALLGTAIANAESRAELAASRTRVVAAADEMRRRVERDLHDGAQQQLVSLMLELRAAQATDHAGVGELRAELARTERVLADVLEELREISRGIHPAILSRGGLERALRTLARRSTVPVELEVRAERRLPARLDVAAYYVVSEALANAAKHARASVVHVELEARATTVRLVIGDDGIGGADPGLGSGLVGISDRVQALGGTLEVTSPAGGGTSLLIEIPLDDETGTGFPEPSGS